MGVENEASIHISIISKE